jgi:hypothetical protein
VEEGVLGKAMSPFSRAFFIERDVLALEEASL